MDMNKFSQNFKTFTNHHFFKFGLPLIILCVGGSFAMTIVQKIKVDHQRQKSYMESLKLKGINLRKPVDWDAELKKIEQVDTSDWQNVRGPRPYEDNDDFEAMKIIQERRLQQKLEQMNRISS